VAKRSYDPTYCGELFIPILDCVNNQVDKCRKPIRCCDFGVFPEGKDLTKLTYDELIQTFKENPDYKPCKNQACLNRRPTIWFTRRPEVDPLTVNEARRLMHKFKIKFDKKFKLATYPNETLTTYEMKSVLDKWEREEDFVPDITILDYIDLLAPDPDTLKLDSRHQEDKKWQRMRRLSEERHMLVVTATQSDAESYEKNLLTMKNFSETKTKHAHVTAEFGLNQNDDEQKIGIIRVNEIVIREGEIDRRRIVRVLQRLQIGRPFLGSY
jgi:hypothetical protein